MVRKNLTVKQKAILDFVSNFKKKNGYAPSYREIAEEFGLSSAATIHQHIQTLQQKGYLTLEGGEARSLKVVEDELQERGAIALPLAGEIAAGAPIETIEDAETMTVPIDLVRDPAQSYVLRVRGNSMIEYGIFDGDFVIVERDHYPKNGDVVVAILENEYATLKRFYREANRIRLQPANRKLRPIYTRNPVTRGVVRAVIRKLL